MKAFNFKQLLPHLIAVGIFLIVSIVFCKPSLKSGVVMSQGDVTGWQGMAHQSIEYNEKKGHFPLWTTNMFCGMPAYQIAIEGDWSPLGIVDKSFQLWLPRPINFFFLCCISFYFLCICIKIRPFASILGSLGYAFCSYSPIIITAGHITKILAMGYSPAVLGAVILLFDKKYLTGFSLLSILTALQIGQSHQQITYYLLIVMIAISINYGISFIKKNEIGPLFKILALMIIAAVLSIAVNAITLFPSLDYSKESKRGGQLVMNNNNVKDKVVEGKTIGLSKDYAFQWSYGKMETLTLMFPGVKGYGIHQAERDGEQYVFPKLGEESNTAQFLMEKFNQPPDQAANIALQQSTSMYWGDQPFTNGPVYLGAIICLMFVIGIFYLDGKHKWWILITSLIAILLSWGDNLPEFNYWVFDNIPFYNKFRVPSMILFIPQLLFPLMASLVLEKLISAPADKQWNKIRNGLIATAGIFVLVMGIYMNNDFSKENTNRTKEFNKIYNEQDPEAQNKVASLNTSFPSSIDNQIYENVRMQLKGNPESQKTARQFLNSIREDRKTFFRNDLIRSFVYVLLASLLIFFYARRKINIPILLIGLTVLVTIDLLSFDTNYLNEYSYTNKETLEENQFPLTQADIQIQQDTDPNFRVWNTTRGLDESKTSYYHKSIGGYHPAKIGIYDDLLSYQLSKQNMSVINMLNTKYVIQQQQDGKLAALRNPGALGNVWFIKEIKWVKGPVEEMKGLDNFDPSKTAVIDEKYRSEAGNPGNADSTDFIKLNTFDNDAITYSSLSKEPRIAIFSEIYYKDWHAYIDNKPEKYFKANYVLRGLNIPAGKHDIRFVFEPAIFFTSKKISFYSSWLIILLFLGSIFYVLYKNKESEKTA